MQQVSISQQDIDNLKEDPNNEVYCISHKNEFVPWDPQRVRVCIEEISKASASNVRIDHNDNWNEFKRLHPVLYELAKSRDERVLTFIYKMIDTRLAVNDGEITNEAAAIKILDGIRANGTNANKEKPSESQNAAQQSTDAK